eukprot:1747815-Pleurochrysis_carterae.AAC.2
MPRSISATLRAREKCHAPCNPASSPRRLSQVACAFLKAELKVVDVRRAGAQIEHKRRTIGVYPLTRRTSWYNAHRRTASLFANAVCNPRVLHRRDRCVRVGPLLRLRRSWSGSTSALAYARSDSLARRLRLVEVEVGRVSPLQGVVGAFEAASENAVVR